MLEGLVGRSPLVGELTEGVGGVEWKVHDWPKSPSIHLAEGLPPHHRHLVNNEVLDFCERLLQLGQSLSLQVLELPSGWQAEEGVEVVAIDVEGSNTSWSFAVSAGEAGGSG